MKLHRSNPRSRSPRSALLGLAVAAATVTGLAAAPSASADARTCISAAAGIMCTGVGGSGTNVGVIRSEMHPWSVASLICNYSAWYYYVPPSRGAYGLGYKSRAGCTAGWAYLDLPLYKTFPRNTLICSKWYQDNGSFVAEKCVGVS